MALRLPYLAVMSVAMFGLVPFAGGCAGSNWQNYDEEFIRAGILGPDSENAPAWVRGEMPTGQDEKAKDEIYFIGRGLGYNVLDERAAYDAARDHVIAQLGKQIATWVSERACEGDVRYFRPKSGYLAVCGAKHGNRFLPGEKSVQWLRDAVKMCTEALAGDLVDRGVYWEQWYIQENPERPRPDELRMKRYKCWVLMSISRQNMESRIQATLKALEITDAQPARLFDLTDQQVRQGPAPRIDPRAAAVMRKM